MITDSDSLLRGRPVAQSEFRSWLDQRYFGHSGRQATSNKLGIIDLVPQHDIEADRQLPGHGHSRLGPTVTEGQALIILLQVRIVAAGALGCLDQQETQKAVALLAEMAETLMPAAGILTRL